MDFNDVIGQQDAKNRLSQMIEEQRIPHALMLCGPKGCGKMAMAMALTPLTAMTLVLALALDFAISNQQTPLSNIT